MRILAPVFFSKSFGGKIEHGQTNVNKETILRKKNSHNTGLENLCFNLTIYFWQSFDFTNNL